MSTRQSYVSNVGMFVVKKIHVYILCLPCFITVSKYLNKLHYQIVVVLWFQSTEKYIKFNGECHLLFRAAFLADQISKLQKSQENLRYFLCQCLYGLSSDYTCMNKLQISVTYKLFVMCVLVTNHMLHHTHWSPDWVIPVNSILY